jgi:uncharacterized membrane protein (DUF373 family)
LTTEARIIVAVRTLVFVLSNTADTFGVITVRLHCLLVLGVAYSMVNSSEEDSSEFDKLLLECDDFGVL